MWYNSVCRDEQNTGAFCFRAAVTNPRIVIRGQSAPYVPRTLVLAVHLDNDGLHKGRFAMKDWHGNVYAKKRMVKYELMKREEWTALRKECFERDNYTCYRCEKTSKNGKGLSAHHVLPRIDGGQDHLVNLITLCNKCHDYVEMEGFTTLIEIVASSDCSIHERPEKEIEREETFARPEWHKYVYGGMKR
jgi:hypothetical protein